MRNKISQAIRAFIADESGPSAVEYAILLALIVVGSIAAILTAGDFQQSLWIEMSDDISTATGN